jgi:2-polyprenyl-6-methoxyphenol hydroxylase-like FAD-dependent oxidoreductase
LTAALELARRGFKSRIVDREPDLFRLSKAGRSASMPRTLTLLSPSRVTDAILQEAQQIHTSASFQKGAGSQTLDTDHRRRTVQCPPCILAQGHTERLLLGKLSDYEVVPEWQTAVETVSPAMSSRASRFESRMAAPRRWSFDMVIGADGAHSIVRKGGWHRLSRARRWRASFYLADFRYAQPVDTAFHRDELFDPGMIGRLPVERGRCATFRRFRISKAASNIRPHGAGADVGIGISASFPPCRDHGKGHVFLAGDAAHIHSPAGARGMNLGIEDACWLAWLISEGTGAANMQGLRMPAVKTVLKQTRQQYLAHHDEQSGG